MTVIGLAILGKRNEPLYLCDCMPLYDGLSNTKTTKDTTISEVDDIFEFTKDRPQRSSLPLQWQLLLHSALDQLDEVTGKTTDAGLFMGAKPISSNWLGQLLQLDDQTAVYGHITVTNVKFLALCQTPCKDHLVRQLLQNLNEHYIHYRMNPFHDLSNEINSASFDQRVRDSLREYQNLNEPIQV
jgi:Sedlin, N-terminal conserved region